MDKFPLKIGFLCSEKKWHELGHSLEQKITSISNGDMLFSHIPLATSVSEISASFDCILQKDPSFLTSDMPELPRLINDPKVYKLLSSRAYLFASLTRGVPECISYFPKYIVDVRMHPSVSIDEIRRDIIASLSFPIIIKNDLAHGSRISHNMCIVAHPEDLTFSLLSSLIEVYDGDEEYSRQSLIGYCV
ncbi:hypothetical protein DI09_13p80 [Mitosporidium daphniae]|uniref:ATP-grasp domain-containing protein n=1 Tax=Mitosporidium daphniae TaxID=1485682 RepID=A0A098VV21_9MICR|nr:uncharacterized protein DI09_13p80 [Mitosporidium daphniae]KGG52719.1 hypothetical protein DI09_13p80 [Mitosporidium daphniae]|eukprot:XP_013239184.1 uncharacterized protein DI09_13p80 [Mitosporidium daphniae]